MRYENEICPVCGKPFTTEDSIVVCPVCGTPQHRDCYDKTGTCVNTHMHDSGYSWTPQSKTHDINNNASEPVPENTLVCTQCGYKNDPQAIFCKNCHAPLINSIEQQAEREVQTIYIDGEPVDENETIQDNVSIREASIYIQSNKNAYIKTFLNAKRNHKQPKFNWAAFIFCPYWFFYRKMYRPGFAFMGINMALYLVFSNYLTAYYDKATAFFEKMQNATQLTPETEIMLSELMQSYKPVMLYFAIAIIISLLAGFLANRIYKARIQQDIMQIRNMSENDKIYVSYLFAKGGTSLVSGVGAVLLYRLLVSFIVQAIQNLG